MADRDKLPVRSHLNDAIVAFEAREHLSANTRAALAHAAVLLVYEVLDDTAKLNELGHNDKVNWDELQTTFWLPSKWRLVATKGFFHNWAIAVISVTYALAQDDWQGPACVGEEVALNAVCQCALSLPDLYQLDAEQLKSEIDLFYDMAFQDTDFEYLFQPESDGIDESAIGDILRMTSLKLADTFLPFNNRTGHPVHVADVKETP